MANFIKEIWLTVLFDLKSVFKAFPTVGITVCGCLACIAIFFAPFGISIILEDCLHYNVDTSWMFVAQIIWWLIAVLVFQTIDRIQQKKADSDKPKVYQVQLTYSSHDSAYQHYYGYGPTDKKDILRDYFVDGIKHILRARYCIKSNGTFLKHVQVFACHTDDLNDVKLGMENLGTPVKVVPEGRQLKSDSDLYLLKDSKSLLDTIDTGNWVIVILNHGLLAGYIEVVEVDNVQH
jgi:hypothetical protein